MTQEDVTMILQLAKLGDTKGLKGYLAGLRNRAKRLDKKVRPALVLSQLALSAIAETAGDVPFWNKRGTGFKAHEAVREALLEFR